MKTAIVIIRTLIGLLFLFASVTFFLNLATQPKFNANKPLMKEKLKCRSKTFSIFTSVRRR